MQVALKDVQMDHGLALSTTSAIGLMSQLSLVTPGIFDYFLMTLMAWYQEESQSEPSPPNLFVIFSGTSTYSQIFIDIFISGFAEQYCKHRGLPTPNSIEFTDAQQTMLSQLFMNNFDEMQRSMLVDFELTLGTMNMVYIWDSSVEGGKDIFYKNNPVVEVW